MTIRSSEMEVCLCHFANGVLPTRAGQAVLANAREILCKERGLVDSLDGLVSTKRLALACTPTFGMAYLPQVLNIFLRTHAEVADLKFIFLQPLEILRRLRNEEFDLTVLEHFPDQEFTGLDRFILPDDELLLVAPAGRVVPDANGYADLAELTRYRLFACRDGCGDRWRIGENFLQ